MAMRSPVIEQGTAAPEVGVPRGRELTPSGLHVADDVLALIGSTPLVRLRSVNPNPSVQLLGKAEFVNPSGSIKDRPALFMVLAAERRGQLKSGSTIIEATSGNTGISLAMIAAARRYRCMLVMPENMSPARQSILRAYGAEVVLTPAGEGMAGALGKARSLALQLPSAFLPSQFENPANPDSHAEGTAHEILEQTGGHITLFVAGVGTGGTVSGVGRVLRRTLGDQVRVVAVEPAGNAVLSGQPRGSHGIAGLGAGFIPEILDRDVIDEVIAVGDVAAERMARRLAQEEGMLVGPSSGANVHVACELAARTRSGTIVTVLCDAGTRYL